jgi:serine/threonine-protein kinase
MADVFLARDTFSGQFVAVKLLSSELRVSKPHRERILREAELSRNIAHPTVVETLDSGVADCGTPYIVLEALVGETLHDYIERSGAMPISQALPLLRQLAEALKAVHDAGVVHGDVKPKNVFLCGSVGEPKSVKLIDFGLARPVCPDNSEMDAETIAGTLEYLAPEQAVADNMDARSDIYAFGVIAFRWLTGELPFDTTLGTQLLAHQLVSPAPPLSWLVPSIAPALEALVLTCMRKAKENRYPSMNALLADLVDIEMGATDVVPRPLVTAPDAYIPETELGKRALKVLLRADHSRLSLPSVA